MTYEQIHNLFKQRYNQANWKQFLGQAFAKARLLPTPETLTGIDSNVASQVQKLGYVTLNENGIDRQIAVFDVSLAEGIILERNRVGLRNLLRKYWKDIDAAFIAYHKPESGKWRFTYVSELTGYDADGEFIKVKTEPKRYTYVLGEGESTRTAAERFTAIATKGSRATLDDVKEAFSVEKLSKTFFDEYKKQYDIFCDFMVSKPNIRQTIFNGDEKGIRDFNKKLLGRMVFLYFVQKKGWLGVPLKEDWGKGDFNFLTNQFENFRNKDLFYKDFLSVLFFETLNTHRKDDIFNFDNNNFILQTSSLVKIPFLSGGLFDEDDQKQRDIIFPANFFKSLFDFLNQYNFTIYEDDPNDHTVAVDPEMLGHIFENLLEDNKDKGAFYTPKEIVHYMCQESLIEYLSTWFENKGYEVVGYIGFDKPDQPKLFSANEGRKGQLIMETDTKGLGKQIDRLLIEKLLKKKLDDEDKKLIISNSNEFHNALDTVKICDPAIGSGAFPMGLLHEIFTAKQTLHTFEHGNTKTFDASAVKLNIIQNSIYGVDIEKGAVDIARLRFWLSLIVDEEKPKALPNLDYKIVVGNSLVSKLGDEIIDIDWNLKDSVGKAVEYVQNLKKALAKLTKKQKDYFEAEDKSQLKIDIRNLKLEILFNQLSFNKERFANSNNIKTGLGFGLKPAEVKKNLEIKLQLEGFDIKLKTLNKLKDKHEAPLHFFDWKLDFPEVMNEQVTSNIGFDIVIGNPPYVGEKGNKNLFEPLKHTKLGREFYIGKMDIYYFFFHQGINLLKENGSLNYITTNYYLTSTSGKKLRSDFRDRTAIINLINFNEYKIFESALGQHNIITMLLKGCVKRNAATSIVKFKGIFDSVVLNSILNKNCSNVNYRYIEQESLFNDGNLKIEDEDIDLILNKISENLRLEVLADVKVGLRTGIDKISNKHKNLDSSLLVGDSVFVIKKDEITKFNEYERDVIKPLYKNSNIKKWVYNPDYQNYVLYIKKETNIDKYVSIESHLRKFKKIISLVRGNDGETWYSIVRPRESSIFLGEKIICSQRTKYNDFAYNNSEFYASSDVYYIRNPKNQITLKYLLAILNSKLIYTWLYNRGKRKGEYLELYQEPLSKIPIKEVKSTNQVKLEGLVEQIIYNKNRNKETSFHTQEIDNLVYKLYELTYEEVKVIDPAFGLSEAEYEAIQLE
jgi:adenine-specific DNA-methyltransferase